MLVATAGLKPAVGQGAAAKLPECISCCTFNLINWPLHQHYGLFFIKPSQIYLFAGFLRLFFTTLQQRAQVGSENGDIISFVLSCDAITVSFVMHMWVFILISSFSCLNIKQNPNKAFFVAISSLSRWRWPVKLKYLTFIQDKDLAILLKPKPFHLTSVFQTWSYMDLKRKSTAPAHWSSRRSEIMAFTRAPPALSGRMLAIWASGDTETQSIL